MSDAQKEEVDLLAKLHRIRLFNLMKTSLTESGTHEQYASALHDEFVRDAQDQLDWYKKNMPEGPNKQFFVIRAEHNLEKAQTYKRRTTFWPAEVFKTYREIKLDCIRTLEVLDDRPMAPTERKLARQEAFRLRRKKIEDLLRKLKLEEDEDVERAQRAELRQKHGFDK